MNEEIKEQRKSLGLGTRIFQNIGALILGGLLSYVLSLLAFSGIFTADMMNQYGEIVDNLSGSEILVDISTGGKLIFKTTKKYKNLKGMISTIYYDQDNLSFNTGTIKSKYPIDTITEDNTLKLFIHITGTIENNTKLFSLEYTGQNAWWTQTKTVFITEADFGGDNGLEDLIVFTNTPKNPNGYDTVRE